MPARACFVRNVVIPVAAALTTGTVNQMVPRVPRAFWLISIGLLLICYPAFDYAVLHHRGVDFLPYVAMRIERAHVLVLGAALIFMAYATSQKGARPVATAFAAFNWQWAAVLVVAFASMRILADKIQPDPFRTSLWQEYTAFILGRRTENMGTHPLFQPDTYLPPLYHLPFKILNDEIVQLLAVILCWTAPLLILLYTLRKVGLDAVTSFLVVLLTSFIGQNYLQGYMLAPNPFTYYNTLDFRMTVIPCAALMVYFSTAGRWFTAGLFSGLAVVSHIKFGFRVWLMTTFILGVLAVLDRLRDGLSLRAIARFQIGFFMVFAGVLRPVVRALHAFDHVNEPKSPEMISPLGVLIKNEPDDWLLLYQPAAFLIVNVVFCIAAIMLCIWLVKREDQGSASRVARVGALASGFALCMLGIEVLFEKFGMTFLPWQISLTYLLNRPWDLLWVAPLALTLTGSVVLLNGRFKGAFFNGLITSVLAAYFGLQLHNAIASPQGLRTLVATWASPAAVLDYSVLTICSAAAHEHQQARSAAVAALRGNDLPQFEAAISRMRSSFPSGLTEGPLLRTDLEADNLVALEDMRKGDYSAAFAKLRAQDAEIQRLSPAEHPWSGDLEWECAPSQKTGTTGWRSIVLPWNDFDQALTWVAAHAPPGTGLIHPASLPAVAALSDHPSFWLTKFDSHSMYLYPAYYPFGLHRLDLIGGPGALELSPGFRSGDPGENGRRFFLGLKAEDFSHIQARYRAYHFILTERDHRLDLPLLFSNSSFAIYRCCSQDH